MHSTRTLKSRGAKTLVATLTTLGLIAAGLVLAVPAQAATGTASINGHVTVPTGGNVRAATVEILTADTLSRIDYDSPDDNGDYVITGIAAGNYKLRVTFSSYSLDLPTPQWFTAGATGASGLS